MFDGADSFDQDISLWDTSTVEDMSFMFSDAESFDQDIGNWDTGNVEDMRQMFAGARSFNQDISKWDTGNVEDMKNMFDGAHSFDQDISAWCVEQVTRKPPRFDHNASEEDGFPDSISESEVVQKVIDETGFDADEDVYESIKRVQSRGASHSESLRIHFQYASEVNTDEGLYSVKGIGPVRGYRLEQAGINKKSKLRKQSVQELSTIESISEKLASRIHENLQASITESSDNHRQSESSSNDSLDQGNQHSSQTSNYESASGHTDSSDPQEREISINTLSEYYESLRSVRKVLSVTLQADANPIAPDDLTHPLVQYYTMLDACLTFGVSEVNFSGYGLQHRSRLEFSVDDYRAKFGDGQWVRNYQMIDVRPFHSETEAWLNECRLLNDGEKLIRPVMPGSEHPLPEFVETKEELKMALTELSKLPAYPELPVDPSVTDRRIPIRELYSYIFSRELADEHTLESGEIEVMDDPDPRSFESPVTESTPSSEEEVVEFLMSYEKLTHIFGRIKPPGSSPIQQSVPVFSLDWYAPRGQTFAQLRQLAKKKTSESVDFFLPRLRDLINRRFLQDTWQYDYITVFPGHEENVLSPALQTLSRKSVVDTNILYTPLLRRTETVDRQRGKSREERLEQARNPSETLQCQSVLDGELVLLLDDISTSGASLLAGAHKIRQAGAGRVIGLTLGLTPGESIHTTTIKSPDSYASEIIAGI